MNVSQAIQHAEHIKQISDTPLKDISIKTLIAELTQQGVNGLGNNRL